ncbi:HDOD domain-containing protein [Pseudomonas sp. JM0905a]|uniref:HDOD domain-containing protein n=1 Tax=Metapseudomonas resinovorans TaxID=53412 RepID=A0ABT4Y7Y6_METRE|nr:MULTISPECIES: HDOD domain-containing protein [Pseudomonas]MBD2839595.1 HDOD domain-containing protein [Pseudomonas sp. JM0905a]MDA8484934.1 HDOD domain-containing protein [Pseudomonas resinovorans]
MNAVESDYSIYRKVVTQLMNGEEQLPSLPMITLDIRRALADPNVSVARLKQVISRDPALSALLMKHASSIVFRSTQPPRTLEDVIRMLGLQEVDRITLVHSLKSLFTLHSVAHKQLFVGVWGRLTRQAAISAVLARPLGFTSPDHALLASLLCDVGELAVLSAFKDASQVPGPEVYARLCREYGQSLSVIVLQKWAVDQSYIEVVRGARRWDVDSGGRLSLIDLVNLGLYHAMRDDGRFAQLPPLDQLAAFRKLVPPSDVLDAGGGLALVSAHQDAIQRTASLLR